MHLLTGNFDQLKKVRADPDGCDLDNLYSKEVEIFVQTASVLGTFLLMVGKRSDGRRVLLELFDLIMSGKLSLILNL